MKHRNMCKHAQLVREVVDILRQRFVPSSGHIKKRIECLIDQEYIKRDANDRGMYKYVS